MMDSLGPNGNGKEMLRGSSAMSNHNHNLHSTAAAPGGQLEGPIVISSINIKPDEVVENDPNSVAPEVPMMGKSKRRGLKYHRWTMQTEISLLREGWLLLADCLAFALGVLVSGNAK